MAQLLCIVLFCERNGMEYLASKKLSNMNLKISVYPMDMQLIGSFFFFLSDLGREDSSAPVTKDENTPMSQDTRTLPDKSLQKSAKVIS